MRAARLLTIQMLLQTRGRMSASALARALEVSVRTLHRDIDELTAAGVPVYAERGRAGGFQLLPGWTTSLTGLTPPEAEAVFLGGLAGPAADLGLGAQVRSAELKLLSALPATWQGPSQRIRSRLHLDPVDWYREAAPPQHLQAVSQAVWHERQLAIRYASWKRTATRVVHPLGLVLKAGVWYLVAARDGQPRTYRVDAIETLDVLQQASTRPKGFDLAAYWGDAVRRFEAELHAGRAEVAATARGLAALRQLGAPVARALRDVAVADGEERARVRIPVEADAQASAQLLRLAPEVEVLGPPALRQAVLDRLQAAAALYGCKLQRTGRAPRRVRA
ncbi:MAG: helix-turn-helix transcriptional regulator [Ramlibacter sp.]